MTEETSILRYKELALNRRNFMVVRAGRPIELSAREFQLLEYLMANPGRAVSKYDLIEGVWGGRAVAYNIVEVYISYLRRKIDDPFDEPYIKTRRGFGYMFGAPDYGWAQS